MAPGPVRGEDEAARINIYLNIILAGLFNERRLSSYVQLSLSCAS